MPLMYASKYGLRPGAGVVVFETILLDLRRQLVGKKVLGKVVMLIVGMSYYN